MFSMRRNAQRKASVSDAKLGLDLLCLALLGVALLGLAWLGFAWLGFAWLGFALLCLAWLCLAWLARGARVRMHVLVFEGNNKQGQQ